MRTEITARYRGKALLALSSLVGLGCAAAQPTSEFPTRDQLAALAASPPPRLKVGNDVDVGAWKLTGPLPDAIDDAPEDGSTPWGQAALNAAAKRPGVILATKAMGCAAHESASFLLEHKALPGLSVSRFIAGRCGVPISQFRTASVTLPSI